MTFVVGAVVGIVGDRLFLLRRGMPQRSASAIVARLDRQLHFTDQQRAQVTEIITRHQQKIVSIWSGVRPAVRQEIEGANAEIDRVLTPEQRAKFSSMRMRLMPRHPGGGIRARHD
ncbi:MAG TPA: hypothetical protein VF980_13270 [Thermoanaerobaculia bacterium]